jgi:transcriptional regulator with XRE-family HTH domain
VSSDERVGQYLANQRRLRRISIEELAERTRIPRRNLERLESGAFDSAADGFTRGFVRTVAEALGLDAGETVMRLVGGRAPRKIARARRDRPSGCAWPPWRWSRWPRSSVGRC